jgi:octaprenyl-diphosphate synthase
MLIQAIAQSSLADMTDSLDGIVGGGKMLRAQLVLQLARVTGVDAGTAVSAAAAVELTHAASLLHDDVIDASERRRGKASFWLERGVSAAILLGDFLFCRAFTLLEESGAGHLVSRLVIFSGEMCETEVRQELLLSAEMADWETSLSIARGKTGSLFAFAAEASCSDFSDTKQLEALRNAGYALGTAYQMADDMLDAFGNPTEAGKTLRNDAAKQKTTAASTFLAAGQDPRALVMELCDQSIQILAEWPHLESALRQYVENDFLPVITVFFQDA